VSDKFILTKANSDVDILNWPNYFLCRNRPSCKHRNSLVTNPTLSFLKWNIVIKSSKRNTTWNHKPFQTIFNR